MLPLLDHAIIFVKVERGESLMQSKSEKIRLRRGINIFILLNREVVDLLKGSRYPSTSLRLYLLDLFPRS
ncbi:hypothetical protein CMV_007370 [Castanea mollissima]|uniref:Uncharacterized protein n=1 Tax=Castanea mollissima TaxID=60419 RepID=A0A8J4RI85_9ROSI|nr:hypothetical protein CMV_007370 [Castanea mollissima]